MSTTTSTRTESPMKELARLGQSIWLDYIRRNLIISGDLKRLVDEGLGGVTSNPAIFEKAITGSTDYNDLLDELHRDKSLDARRGLRAHRGPRHSGRRRYSAPGLRSHRRPRRLRQPGSFPVSGE